MVLVVSGALLPSGRAFDLLLVGLAVHGAGALLGSPTGFLSASMPVAFMAVVVPLLAWSVPRVG